MRYQINSENDRSNLSFVTSNGELHVLDSDNPAWYDVVEAVLDGDEYAAIDAMDAAKAAQARFQKVTDRVSVSPAGVVTFDGDEVHNSLADAIVRALREGQDFTGLVLF